MLLQTNCGVEFEIFKPLLSSFPFLVESSASCLPIFVPRFFSAVFNFLVGDSKGKCFRLVECRSDPVAPSAMCCTVKHRLMWEAT